MLLSTMFWLATISTVLFCWSILFLIDCEYFQLVFIYLNFQEIHHTHEFRTG
jgi:hypothetical protein